MIIKNLQLLIDDELSFLIVIWKLRNAWSRLDPTNNYSNAVNEKVLEHLSWLNVIIIIFMLKECKGTKEVGWWTTVLTLWGTSQFLLRSAFKRNSFFFNEIKILLFMYAYLCSSFIHISIRFPWLLLCLLHHHLTSSWLHWMKFYFIRLSNGDRRIIRKCFQRAKRESKVNRWERNFIQRPNKDRFSRSRSFLLLLIIEIPCLRPEIFMRIAKR